MAKKLKKTHKSLWITTENTKKKNYKTKETSYTIWRKTKYDFFEPQHLTPNFLPGTIVLGNYIINFLRLMQSKKNI